jgi:Leu/Phe-tRNA-protein transferase
MSEKFKMKNVASRTDRASFTVWIKTAFSRMTTQCAAARRRLQSTGYRYEEQRTRRPPKADVSVL